MSTILAFTVDEACSVARIGKTGIYKAVGTGVLVARSMDARRLFCERPASIYRKLANNQSKANRSNKRKTASQLSPHNRNKLYHLG